ncbi:MAG: FecR domain-containing protein [Proteobacteria bacterium]|nr:FecR domain-containing protein [Pseudomonadota bacterium]
MSRIPEWMKTATEPTDAEIDAVDGRLPDASLHALRIASSPTDAEVARVVAVAMARRRTPAPWGRGLALAGAVAAAALFAWPLRFGPIDLDAGEVAHIEGPVAIGHATTISGSGDASLLRADRTATVVEVVDGALTFEVDPQARFRDVRVVSDDIEVRVRGTRFTVSDAPSVEVERGHVEVFRDGVQIADLRAGEVWPAVERDPLLVAKPSVKPSARAKPTPVAVRKPRIEPPGWKPRAKPMPAVQAVLSAPVARLQIKPHATPSPAPVVPASRPSAAMAFATVLSRADAGRDAGVLAADWSIFLGNYPEASVGLRSEAKVRRLEAQLESLRPEAAVDAIDAFLAETPNHPRQRELAYAKATLLRGDLADCGSAVPAYRLAASGDGELAARSEVFLGLCLLHLGDADGALEAVERARALGVPEDVERFAARVLRKLHAPR